MIAGFVIWTVCALLPVGIGIHAWNAKKPVGFFASEEPPEVKDPIRYNHAVSRLWIAFALLFELLGLPLFFLRQNSPVFILPILGTVFLCIGLILVYFRILAKHGK